MKVLKIAAAICVALVLPRLSLAAPSDAPATASVEVGFSPDGSGEALVLRAINSARQSVRLAAYAFTARPVVRALIDARKRGVDVAVVVDYKNNLSDPSWTLLTTIAGDGRDHTVSDSPHLPMTRFYRVRVVVP